MKSIGILYCLATWAAICVLVMVLPAIEHPAIPNAILIGAGDKSIFQGRLHFSDMPTFSSEVVSDT